MNYPIIFNGRRNARAFISAIISYLMLAGQVAPVALAANAAAPRPAPQPVAAAPSKSNFAPAPVALAVGPVISATKVDAFPDPNSDGKADPGETITYTVTISNTGTGDATGVQFNDTIDANTTLVGGQTTVQPITAPDTYNVIGNVDIHLDAAAGLLANDCNPDLGGGPCSNSGLTVTTLAGDNTAPFSGTSTNGGQVTSSTSDGAFTYNPPPGFAGTDTFTYTVTNAQGKTDTGTVTLNVGNGTGTPGTNVIWFVNASAPSGGDGRLTSPFNCYTGASASCFSQTAADDPGDAIFLFSGAYTGGNTLLNNQKLIGAGASDTLVNLTGVTVPANSDTLPSTGGAAPTITTTNVNAIPLGQNNLLRGFTVGNVGTGTKISGTSFGTLTVGNSTTPDVTLNGTGQALNLSTGAFAATSAFSSVTTTSSATQGINLAGITGTVAFGSTTVSGSTTQGILIGTTTAAINFGNTSVTGGTDGVSFQNNSSGTRTFGTLGVSGGSGSAFLHGAGGGNVTVNGAATLASTSDVVNIANAANGTAINFAGGATVTKTTTGGNGVNWSGTNTGATLTFATLALTTSNGTGMNLSGGGTVNVTTTAGSSISTTGVGAQAAPAINASGVAVGMNFTTITATGGGSGTGQGITLASVTGSLTVNNGASTSTNIQNTGGAGINVTSSSATLNFGNTTINSTGGTGIILGGSGTGNSGAATFGALTVTPDSGAAGINAQQNTGAITVPSGTVTTTNATAVQIQGTSSGSKTPLNIQLTTVNTTGGATAANGIFLKFTSTSGAPGGFTVTGNGGTCTFASSGTCTGGRITNTSGADNTTGGIGVYLEDVASVSLTRMHIDNHTNFAIRGKTVNNFTLQTSVIDGNNGTSVTADADPGIGGGEDAVRFFNLTGSALIDSSVISGGELSNLRVINNTGTLNRLTVSNTLIGDPDAVGSGQRGLATNGNDVTIDEEDNSSTPTMNVTFTNDTLNFAFGDVLRINNNDNVGTNGNMDVVVRGNTLVNNNPRPSQVTGASIVTVAAIGNTTYDVSCNKVANSLGNALVLFKAKNPAGTPSGTMSGTVFNNTVGITGQVNSGGGAGANGIEVDMQGTGTHTILIKNNVIRNFGNAGISISTVDNLNSTATMNATVIGNSTFEPNSAFAGLLVVPGAANTDASQVTNILIGGSGAAQNNFVNGDGSATDSGGSGTDVFFNGFIGTTNLSKGVSSSSVFSTVISDNNVNPVASGTANTVTIVSTVPALPAAINESCSPPAAPGTIDGFGIGAPSGLPATTGGEETPAKVGARSLSGATAGVTSRPFIAMPRQTTQAQPAAPTQAKTATGKPSVASSTGRRITPAPNAPPCTNDSAHVCIQLGTLRAGDSVTITFQVTVNNPYSGGPNVSNQGTISFNETGSPVLTDDPAVGGASDPTLTPINSTHIVVNDAKQPEPTSGTSQMLFTLTLTQPAPGGGLSVNYATADQTPGAGHATGGASCDGTADYVTASGTATVPAGSKVVTIPVTVCADNTPGEPDETFLLNISSPSNGVIDDNQAVGTITQGNAAGAFLISELRTSGPGGLGDDFVELYNNTDTPLTVAASDASAGYGLFKQGADCNATPVLIATVPNGTVIPARGHYLVVGSQYSLANYGGAGAAAGNQTMTADIESDANVSVFSTANVANVSSANRLDAVGFGTNTGGVCDLMREGGTLPPVSGSTTQHSFFRKECDFVNGVGCSTPGNPKDTNDNSADFKFADTLGSNIAGVPQQLGAPGPENMTSPIRRDATIQVALLDGNVSSSVSPNRVRDPSATGPNAAFGTLSIRRRVKNNTGGNVTRLRFRVVEVTTFPASGALADVRALTSADTSQTGVTDAGTCAPAAAPCTVTIRGTTLETPPNQPNGGGINSTLAVGFVTLGTPLANGATVDVQFLLGVQTTGTFRFLIITEALP